MTREDLVLANLPLVDYAVRELASRLPGHVGREDLVSAGQLALTQAAAAFDPGRGVPFAAYARTRIRGALIDELRTVDWASRGVRSRARSRDNAVEALGARLGRTPTRAEVAAELGTSIDDVAALDGDLNRSVVLSLQGFAAGVDVEGMVSSRAAGPEAVLLHRERAAYVVAAVQALPDRLRTVVVGWFFEDRPMAELARELGVTESRISQLRAEAMSLLALALTHHLRDDAPAHRAAAPTAGPPAGVADRRRAAYVAAVGNTTTLHRRMTHGRPSWASPAAVDGVV
jgi:RNA polymerase sigma factor for flagellar operon FliA